MENKFKQSGMTLIEIVIYSALFSIIIGGGMIATYEIISSTDNGANRVVLQEEANFLLRKISWALTGATNINIISTTRLQVTKSSSTYTFNLCGTNLTIESGAGKTCSSSPIILNSSSIKVSSSNLFSPTTSNGGLITDFTLTTVQNGKNVSQSFSTTKFLRQ